MVKYPYYSYQLIFGLINLLNTVYVLFPSSKRLEMLKSTIRQLLRTDI